MAAVEHFDVVVIGAGGAGMMCAMEAGKRGRGVLLLDHEAEIGRKILISGGGRCNFTNVGAKAERYISGNKHFAKSAFGQYTPQDFIALVEKHGIAYHEKKLGQLFCDGSAQQIVDMLVKECDDAGVELRLSCAVNTIEKTDNGFVLETVQGRVTCESLVIATGGLSIPKMGATNFGYKVAQQFGLKCIVTEPALVPFTFIEKDLSFYDGLSGISFDAEVRCGKVSFRENVLMTHRGVSGPAILQISSYWEPGQEIHIRINPEMDWLKYLKEVKAKYPKRELKTAIYDVLAKRLVERLFERAVFANKHLAEVGDKELAAVAAYFTDFVIKPNGTEGYRKAEVTRGGVDTDELKASTMECKRVPGLYFIGEVVDVTGWLGGYNFQWAWASGAAAGRAV